MPCCRLERIVDYLKMLFPFSLMLLSKQTDLYQYQHRLWTILLLRNGIFDIPCTSQRQPNTFTPCLNPKTSSLCGAGLPSSSEVLSKNLISSSILSCTVRRLETKNTKGGNQETQAEISRHLTIRNSPT